EAPARAVYEDTIRKYKYDRLTDSGARIDRFGMIFGEVAATGRSDVESHADTFAPVVIAAACNWADIAGAGAEILRHHLGVALESAACKKNLAGKALRPAICGAHLDAGYRALLVASKRVGCRFIEECRAVGLGKGGQCVNKCLPAANGTDTRR